MNPNFIPIITGSAWTRCRTSNSRGSTRIPARRPGRSSSSRPFRQAAEGGEDRQGATDFYIRLTNLQSDYRRVGVNYNQVAKAVHSGELTEKKALALLYKLEQLTVEYISLNKEIIRLTKEFERWLQR